MTEEEQLLQMMNVQNQSQATPYDLMGTLQAMGPKVNPSVSVETKVKRPVANRPISPQDVGAPLLSVAAPKVPITDQLFQQLVARQTQGLEQQRQGLGDLEKQAQQFQKPQMSELVKILAAGSDVIGGGNTFQNILQQEQDQKKQGILFSQNLQKFKNDLTDKEIDLLKTQFQNASGNEKLAMEERLMRMKLAREDKQQEKTLTASETEQLADLKNQIGSLENIYQDWETKVGPSTGTVDFVGSKAAGLIPNTDVSQYKTNLKQKAQLIGKALEGGKLTDVDYEKYIKFLPQPGDSAETARQRVENLRQTMTTSYQNRVKTFGEAGYKTGGFSPIKDEPFKNKNIGPKEGDTKEYDGKKYVVKGGSWVPQ